MLKDIDVGMAGLKTKETRCQKTKKDYTMRNPHIKKTDVGRGYD